MNITKKEVITKIYVEISKDEFVGAYMNMMEQIKNGTYQDELVSYDIYNESVDKYFASNDSDKVSRAIHSFTSLFGIFHSATIRFIAQQNGYKVDCYGAVDSSTRLLNAVFYARGNRI